MQIKLVNTSSGEEIQRYVLTPSQEKFWETDKKFTIMSGGFGSGKTCIFLLRVLFDCITQNDQYFLLGRKTYQEIYDVLLKDFLDICPPSYIKKYTKSPHPSIELYTVKGGTSTIIFRNLDKLAVSEIKGLNLGGFAIDQAEDIDEATFQALCFRLRRKNVNHRVYLTCNPALTWLFKVKQESNQDWKLIEAPTPENYHNLPAQTVELYESYKTSDPAYYKQYVLGVWDESLLAENTVFAKEHIINLEAGIRKPGRTYEGLDIYVEPKKDKKGRYQMGIDCAEGIESGDEAAITITDMDTLEEVASWAGKIPPDAAAEKAVQFAKLFPCLMVPEMNSMGLALINKLKELGYTRIYEREELDKKSGKKLLKLGWRTTSQTKPLLISHFRDLLRNLNPILHSRKTLDQFKTFIYTDESKQKGAGAEIGFHDDRVISLLLSFWERTPRRDGGFIRKETVLQLDDGDMPILVFKNNKLQWKIPGLEIENKKWTTT